MSQDLLARLRSRLQATRADALDSATAQELDLCLSELEVVWEELESQADLLARERQRYTYFFDRAPFACVITDSSGLVREANSAALELLDVAASYVVGKPAVIFFADAGRASFRSALVKATHQPPHRQAWSGQLKHAEGLVDIEVIVQSYLAAKGAPAALLLFLRRLD